MTTDLRELLEQEAQRVRPTRAPVDAVLTEGYTRLRRRRIGTVAIALVLAALVAVGPWAADLGRDGDTIDRPLRLHPDGPPWDMYSVGDRVVLGDTTVDTPDNESGEIVAVPDGAIVLGEADEIIFVTRDGSQRTIGEPGSQPAELTSNPESGLVAWREFGPRGYEVVVYDTTAGSDGAEIARWPLGSAERAGQRCSDHSPGPIAIDGDVVYFCGSGGDYAWRPAGTDEPRRLPTHGTVGGVRFQDRRLLDVQAGTQAASIQVDGSEWLTAVTSSEGPEHGVVIDHAMKGAFLSPDGRYLGRFPDGETPGGFPVVGIYETGTGEPVGGGLRAGTPIFGLAFGADSTVTYAVGETWTDPELDVVTCEIPTEACSTVRSDVGRHIRFAGGISYDH